MLQPTLNIKVLLLISSLISSFARVFALIKSLEVSD